MRNFTVAVVVGACALAASPGQVQADPLTEATVEGDGNFTSVGTPNSSLGTFVWACHATASAPVRSTSVTCTFQIGAETFTTSSSSDGAATSTVPQVTQAWFNDVRICWEAEVVRLDGSVATDSGCKGD
ncbi:MAG TPA: hypothetical protein VF230_00875 [Acidimicrobiales bacterium]